MACVICPWDISTHVPQHELVLVHGMCDKSLGHDDSFTVCIKKSVYHSAWMETDNISMSLGHEFVPVHGMRDMSLRHIDAFTFCIKTPCKSWHLDGAWLYFHVPGTWINSCSWHAWYVPGTYRYICILYQYFPFVMAPGWGLIIFPCPRDMN